MKCKIEQGRSILLGNDFGKVSLLLIVKIGEVKMYMYEDIILVGKRHNKKRGNTAELLQCFYTLFFDIRPGLENTVFEIGKKVEFNTEDIEFLKLFIINSIAWNARDYDAYNDDINTVEAFRLFLELMVIVFKQDELLEK